MPLGPAIVKLRLERDLSQRKLAALAGITRAQLRWIEDSATDQHPVALPILLALCAALNISLDQLLLAAGLLQPPDPAMAQQLQELQQLFLALPPERRPDALAIIRAITTGPPE